MKKIYLEPKSIVRKLELSDSFMEGSIQLSLQEEGQFEPEEGEDEEYFVINAKQFRGSVWDEE